jgi:hypothetical protein
LVKDIVWMDSGEKFNAASPGTLVMFFLRSVDFSQPAHLAPGPASVGVIVCPLMYWAPSVHAEGWFAIYRLAHEQVMKAIAPSAFQRMVEPSMN